MRQVRLQTGVQGRRARRGALLLVLVTTVSAGLVSIVAPKAIATDPSGAWTAASSLGAGRGKGTSTLLDGPACRTATPAAWCGKVLAAGGQQSGKGSLSSAELYDPGTGQWSFTGSMRAARYGHTATLLDGSECQAPPAAAPPYCGKVLVAGGAGGPAGRTVLDSAELYNPATGEWSPTGRMAPLGETGGVGQPRFAHTASALDGPPCRGTDLSPLPAPDWCGRVVVVGGLGTLADTSKFETLVSAALRSAFLYDPESGTWAITGAPAVGRYEHTLTAIDDGPCRGGSPPLYCGRLLLAGGTPIAEIVAAGTVSAELYDPGLGQWVPTGAMITPRFSHGAVVLAGANCPARPQCNKVLVTGGLSQRSAINHPQDASAELYDPVTGTWSSTGNALYDEDTGAQLPTRGMVAGRGPSHTLTLLDGRACRTTAPPGYCGKVLVVGDETSSRAKHWLPGLLGPPPKLGPGSSVPAVPPPELYDPVSGSFSPTRARLTRVKGNAVLIDGPSCRGTTPASACGQVLHFDATGSRQAELFDGAATSQPPTVASLDPPSGPAGGGTLVTLRGAGLTGATEVRFGDAAALEFSHEGDNTVKALSPAMAAGEVDVTVSVGGRTSAAISTTRFAVFPSNFEWTTTGSLVSARRRPTVTPLGDGRALVVGGVGASDSGGVDSAELFDPSAGRWDSVPPLSTARNAHTATLLPNGEVLVAGGSGPTCCLASAEVFNPATGLWRRTGTMIFARNGHTATLLPSGKVLVAGGAKDAQNAVQSTAELYDPDVIDPTTGERGVWAEVAPMRSYRQSHHAALLADGRVLVVGGAGCDSIPTPVVDRGDWKPSCGNPPPRRFPDSSTDTVFDARGNSTSLRSVEVYDPAAGAGGTWSATGGLSALRGSHTTTSLSTGGVLVAGGCANSQCGSPEPAELYDPDADDPATGAKGTWRTVKGMAAPRFNHTATVLAGPTCAELCGHVLFAGGDGQSSAELYDPSTGAWRPAPPLASARGSHGAALLTDGQVLVVGGQRPTLILTGSAELFRVDAGLPLIAAVEPPAGPPGTRVVIRGADLFETTSVNFGGVSVEPVAVAETAVVAVSPPQRRGPVPVSVTTPFGTSTNSPVSDGDDYTYAAGRWRGGPAMATARFLHTASLLDGPECRRAASPAYCGRVLVAGGTADFAADEHLVPYDSAELYDPVAETWSPTGSMGSPRFDHTATLLDGPACRGDAPPPFCGKVLVAGGRVGASAISGAELYDPASGTWTGTASMKAARLSHTATLLADGRVLVVGGAPDEPNRGGLASAEIYDPASGTWQETADPQGRRNSHTATLLADGKVLVAGGLDNLEDGDDLVRTTEIYDPEARTWDLVEPLAVPRFAHSAVLIDGPRCGSTCGKVLVVGGVKTLDHESTTFHESAELFDPVSRRWTPAFAPRTARAGHTAQLLANGQVLVAGSSVTFPQLPLPTPVASAELWDPLTGRWTPTHELATRRGIAAGAVLDGPACRRAAPAAYCGAVLVAGGGTAGLAPGSIVSPPALRSSEIYSPAPDVHRLAPPGGTVEGGTTVELGGTQLAGASSVRFGGREAASFVVHSPTSITAVSPPADAFGPVEVEVEGPNGSSARIGGNREASYVYLGVPGAVTALAARAVSPHAIELSFASAHAGDGSRPAQAYEVRQSSAEVTEANFDAPSATVLCGGICHFAVPALAYTLQVGDLEPGHTYHYAIRAVNDKGRGPLSVSVSATTEPLAPDAPPPAAECARPAAAGAAAVVYPGGRYSLLGLPDGVVVRSQSPLYGWSDLGAGGTYSIFDSASPVTAGRGYWAWFSCPTAVTLPAGAGDGGATSFPLGAYHASMVGNPTNGQVSVTGHDFAATWDAQAGTYRMSGYREPQALAVGEGVWTFSYMQTEVHIKPPAEG